MLIIKDVDTGKSYPFVEIGSGYSSAAAKIHEIEKQGHRVSGDVDKVLDLTHQSRHETGFIQW